MSASGVEILGEGEYAWYLLERVEDNISRISDHVEINQHHLQIYGRQIALAFYETGTLVEAVIKKIITDDTLDSLTNMTESLRLAREEHATIRDYRNVLEPLFALSRRTADFRLFKFASKLQPFNTFLQIKDVSPDWWRAYNQIKHDFLGNLELATIRELIQAAGGLFLLTVLCRPYWPALVLNNHILGGLLGKEMFVTQSVDKSELWKKLHEAFMPHVTGTGSSTFPIVPDIYANSRLFFSYLAHQNPSTNRYDIP